MSFHETSKPSQKPFVNRIEKSPDVSIPDPALSKTPKLLQKVRKLFGSGEIHTPTPTRMNSIIDVDSSGFDMNSYKAEPIDKLPLPTIKPHSPIQQHIHTDQSIHEHSSIYIDKDQSKLIDSYVQTDIDCFYCNRHKDSFAQTSARRQSTPTVDANLQAPPNDLFTNQTTQQPARPESVLILHRRSSNLQPTTSLIPTDYLNHEMINSPKPTNIDRNSDRPESLETSTLPDMSNLQLHKTVTIVTPSRSKLHSVTHSLPPISEHWGTPKPTEAANLHRQKQHLKHRKYKGGIRAVGGPGGRGESITPPRDWRPWGLQRELSKTPLIYDDDFY